MSEFSCTEDFEEMLANYMDSFTNYRTFQTDCNNLWNWWLHNRHRLPSRRLISLHRNNSREQYSHSPTLGQ